jgi:hypothetical protein
VKRGNGRSRRLGVAHLEEAIVETYRAGRGTSLKDSIWSLCRAAELYGRGCILIGPINPDTDPDLLANYKATGNALVAAQDRVADATAQLCKGATP